MRTVFDTAHQILIFGKTGFLNHHGNHAISRILLEQFEQGFDALTCCWVDEVQEASFLDLKRVNELIIMQIEPNVDENM